MSGGAWEYVMGVMEDSLNSNIPSSGYSTQYNSGFTGKNGYDDTTTTGSAFPESKYYDIYKYGTSNSDLTRYHLGDATTEVKSWNSDYAYFVDSSYPWFLRGGYYNDGARAGVLAFGNGSGSADSAYSARAVLR